MYLEAQRTLSSPSQLEEYETLSSEGKPCASAIWATVTTRASQQAH